MIGAKQRLLHIVKVLGLLNAGNSYTATTHHVVSRGMSHLSVGVIAASVLVL
jgi:hypothetical protein